MLEMLKARKVELEARGKKGFTLMEMLIVIAIIAVLIAIAIPVFSTQLDNADKATTEANARSAYSVLMADYMTGDVPEDSAITPSNKTADKDNALVIDGQKFEAKGQYKFTITNKGNPSTNTPPVVTMTATNGGLTEPIVFGS